MVVVELKGTLLQNLSEFVGQIFGFSPTRSLNSPNNLSVVAIVRLPSTVQIQKHSFKN